MTDESSRIQALIDDARAGDPAAFDALFEPFRERLLRAARLRLDPRVAARVDASDVVQETYVEASRRLAAYLERPEMPFEIWLRWIARERLLDLHRAHLGAEKRAVAREVPLLPADTSAALIDGIVARGPTPSRAAVAGEQAGMLTRALSELDEEEREIVLWRHFERLSNREVASLLGINPAAASKRYVRLLEKLRCILARLGLSSA